ncbi:MAG TPA: ABC transporter ATP-binding protein, partial [Acidimicrobiales bacterium]|nr:ABC transporter ATP-binding protein [Acidimicrobiales bacterium]
MLDGIAAELCEGRPPLLALGMVSAGYGAIDVVRGISLSVRAGEVLAILGPNGAGKSTILKVACGLLRPSAGCFHVLGRHVNGIGPDELARAGICCVPEGHAVFGRLTVRENLWMSTYLGVRRSDVEERAFARFPRLAERRDQVAGSLSGGEQQMLAMARALVAEPAVLLLDEISMGLAPKVVEELYELVGQIALEGVGVVLPEQFAWAATSVAHRAA